MTYWKYFASFSSYSNLFLTLLLIKDMVSKNCSVLAKMLFQSSDRLIDILSLLFKDCLRFWKISGIRMRWSLEACVEYRGSSFSWNLMQKHIIFQYVKLINIKYFIFSKQVPCMFEFGLIFYNSYCMLLLNMKFF